MWYVIGFVAIVGGAMVARKYFYSKPIGFSFEGARYVRQPDGSFTDEAGTPVPADKLAAVKAQWQKINEVDV